MQQQIKPYILVEKVGRYAEPLSISIWLQCFKPDYDDTMVNLVKLSPPTQSYQSLKFQLKYNQYTKHACCMYSVIDCDAGKILLFFFEIYRELAPSLTIFLQLA